MSKFFVKDNQINNNSINIVGEDVNHISNVLRMKKEVAPVVEEVKVVEEAKAE